MTLLPEEHTPHIAKGWALALRVLVALDLVILGGLAALLIVNRLLIAQLDVYEAYGLMSSGSVVLDFMDDMLPYLAIAGSSFLLLVFATISVWLWGHSRARMPRYGVVLLLLVIGVMIAWTFVGRSDNVVSVPMMTPTPVP